MNIEAKAIKI